MQPIVPYIMFKGETKDALAFYAKALGGQVTTMQTYEEAKMEVQPEFKSQVMHATFKAGDLMLMASDASDKSQATVKGNNLSLSLNFNSIEEINNTFNALAENGQITMELQDTFWGARFGMLIDQFGIHWMFNHDYEPKETNK